MVALVGTYFNGYVKLDKEFTTSSPLKVIVTFLEEIPMQTKEGLSLSDFSFAESQKNLKDFKGSLSDSVVEERSYGRLFNKLCQVKSGFYKNTDYGKREAKVRF